MSKPASILVVEDEKPLREAFSFLLESEGYKIESAENGKAAIEVLKKFKPQLIILDMLMPIMGGIQFLQQAPLKEKAPGTKIMVLTNMPNPLSPEEIKKYGISRLITKASLSPSDLAKTVKNLLAN